MKIVKSVAFATVIGFTSLYGASYSVDTSHSDIGFKVKHMMISNVKGNFEKFSGEFEIDEKANTFKKLNGVVDVASLTTQDAKRDGHLKSADFFDVKKYPEMKMKLLEQKGDILRLQLTIKNVTKVIDMQIEELSSVVKDPWGNTRRAFEIHGSINRKDFNINFSKLLETGGVLVGNKVKMDIVIEGIQVK